MSRQQPLIEGFEALTAPQLRPHGIRSTIREFLLIGAGVLAALAGQAGWQRYQEHRLETIYLRELLEDVVEIEKRLESALREERASQETTLKMMAAIQSDDPIPFDTLRAWMTPPGWPMWYGEARYVLGTITALNQSGDLRLLKEDRVRIAISGYADVMEAEKEEFGRWVDLSITNGALLHELGSEAVSNFPVGEELDVRATRVAMFVDAIQDQPELRAILVQLQFARRNRIFYLDRMESSTTELRQLLEESAG
ncbi:MAG: hypothetical protein GEU90_18655 [Gemmatimonas sp.]|nr:hypothetical protein [Gemmatimonas sp.]